MCQHEPEEYIDDAEDQVQLCQHCGEIIAWKCEMCGGEGYGEESELNLDWINYGNDLITCPCCGGWGWEYANEYHPGRCQ